MHIRAVSGPAPSPRRLKYPDVPLPAASSPRSRPAPSIVTSSTFTPPASIASASAIALSTESARSTGTSPISRNFAKTSSLPHISPRHQTRCKNLRGPTRLHPTPYTLLYRCTRAPLPFITRCTSSKVAIVVSPGVVIASAPWSTAAVHRPIRTFLIQEAIDQPRSERIPTTHAVEDLETRQRPRLMKLPFVVAHRAQSFTVAVFA